MGWKLGLTITVFVLAISMTITLFVFWNVYIIEDYNTLQELIAKESIIPTHSRWTILTLGSVFFSLLLVILSLFFADLMRNLRFKRQQRDFVNMVTHELRLPMSNIRMFTQTLHLGRGNPEEQQKFLATILQECERMDGLINHLLQTRQIEGGKLPFHRRPIQLTEFMTEWIANWPRPVDFNAGPECTLIADPVLINYALANLIGNAEKYGQGQQAQVTWVCESDWVIISVLDCAQPIPEKFHRKIFDKFYRLPGRNTKERTGVGLGLFVVRYITKLHKGKVELQIRNDGIGNEFRIFLPLIKGPSER